MLRAFTDYDILADDPVLGVNHANRIVTRIAHIHALTISGDRNIVGLWSGMDGTEYLLLRQINQADCARGGVGGDGIFSIWCGKNMMGHAPDLDLIRCSTWLSATRISEILLMPTAGGNPPA